MASLGQSAAHSTVSNRPGSVSHSSLAGRLSILATYVDNKLQSWFHLE